MLQQALLWPRRGFLGLLAASLLLVRLDAAAADGDSLAISVYCTAGDIERHLADSSGRSNVLQTLRPLGVSRLFLEGRRGGEYVSPEQLKDLRAFFQREGIECSGGIATVPGPNFGRRQQGGLDWLDWEYSKTRSDIAGFFQENAPVFDSLIVDDFFCTGDESVTARNALNGRSWGEYRRDLLVSLIHPFMIEPARKANPTVHLILKYPQWYDRFHLFGYDPVRMSEPFQEIWVGTEVRNPATRRMGFAQPTHGYMNFRWLSSVAGTKVRGAWFDHIECTPQNLVDQAFQSVLAGARELTLFRLGDLMEPHPGDALLASRLPELKDLAGRIKNRDRTGIPYYKPPNSNSDENVYLSDYLGMIGLPVLPVSSYPASAKVAILPVQAAADPGLFRKMQTHLESGATLVLTPALLHALGSRAADLAGVEVGPAVKPGLMNSFRADSDTTSLATPVEVDLSIAATNADVRIGIPGESAPFLSGRQVGAGKLYVLNVRTFSEADYRQAGEWLLHPKPLGIAQIPPALANRIRAELLGPLHISLKAPAGVALVHFSGAACFYNFNPAAAEVEFNGKPFVLPAHGWTWRE